MKFFTLLLLFFAVSDTVLSQSFFLEIAGNVPSKGKYILNKSETLGGNLTTPVTKLSITSDPVFGCTTINNDLKDKIAFIDRGECTFAQKSLNAQAKGAVVVIICNNNNGPDFVPGGTDPLVTVPVFGMSTANCNKIKIDIQAGNLNVTVRPAICGENKQVPADAIWGVNSGEGDFANGLNGWTLSDPNKIKWRSNPRIRGNFTDANVISATACNGFIGASSDSLDNAGICPTPCFMSLTSPNINLSTTKINNLSVIFTQNLREFDSEYLLTVSYDGGNSYPDTIAFNNEIPLNSNLYQNNIIKLPLCKVPKNATQIRMQFIYNGDYYFWAIDDVYLINKQTDDSDVRVNDFLATAPNFISPVNQSQEFIFMGDVQNIGVSTAKNVNLKAEIISPSGQVLHTSNNLYDSIRCYQTIENVPFKDIHKQNFTVPGQYNLRYTISATTDIASGNNVINIPFLISDSTFAKVPRENPASPYLRAANIYWSPAFWTSNVGTTQVSLGNYYKISNGKNKAVSKVRFGLDNSNTSLSGIVNVDLYKIFDEDQDNIIEPAERRLLGTEALVVTSETPNLRFLEVNLKDSDGKTILLEDNGEYAVMIHTEGINGAASTPMVLAYNPDPDEHLVYQTANIYANVLKERPFFSSLIANANNLDIEKRSFSPFWNNNPNLGWFYGGVHFIEMDITNLQTTSFEELDKNIGITVYPNPVNDIINVIVQINEPVSSIDFELIDVKGNKLLKNKFLESQKEFQINVNDLPTGIYFLKTIINDKKYNVESILKK
jgi:hypothetical protein